MENKPTRRGRQFWRAQYDQWQDSNLSRAAFCRQASLNVTSFYYWCKQFTASKIEPIEPGARKPAFIPLSLTRESTPAFSLKVADVTLSCNHPISAHQLHQWLGAIRSTL